MRSLFILLFLPGCVAWQSSIDEIKEELASFKADQSQAVTQFQEATFQALSEADGEIANVASRMESQFQASVQEIENRIAAEPNLTQEDLATAVAMARDDMLTTLTDESRNLKSSIEEARLRVLAEEQARRESERLRAEQAATELNRIKEENERFTRELIAGAAEFGVGNFLNSPAGGALLGKVIRDTQNVTEEDIQNLVPRAIDEYYVANPPEEDDPVAELLKQGGVSTGIAGMAVAALNMYRNRSRRRDLDAIKPA